MILQVTAPIRHATMCGLQTYLYALRRSCTRLRSAKGRVELMYQSGSPELAGDDDLSDSGSSGSIWLSETKVSAAFCLSDKRPTGFSLSEGFSLNILPQWTGFNILRRPLASQDLSWRMRASLKNSRACNLL